MITKENIELKVGQVWRDLDKRMNGRERKIVAVVGKPGKVLMDEPAADFINKFNPTWVSVARMYRHSTGWELVK